MTSYEKATALAHKVITRTGRAAKPVEDTPKRGTRPEWLVEIQDTGERIINSNAIDALAPISMRRPPRINTQINMDR